MIRLLLGAVLFVAAIVILKMLGTKTLPLILRATRVIVCLRSMDLTTRIIQLWLLKPIFIHLIIGTMANM